MKWPPREYGEGVYNCKSKLYKAERDINEQPLSMHSIAFQLQVVASHICFLFSYMLKTRIA